MLEQETRYCEYRDCQQPLTGKRRNAKFCDAGCRKAEYLERQKDQIESRRSETEERFLAFHSEHPEVLQNLQRLAQKKTGRISVKMLYELTREDLRIRLDNTYTSHYARMLVSLHPEYEGRIILKG